MLTLNGSVITSPAGYWFDRIIGRANIHYIVENGVVSGPTSATPGTIVTVSVTPNTGCAFNYITVDGMPIPDTSFVVPYADDVYVNVICEAYNPYNLPAKTVRIKFSNLSTDPRQPVYPDGDTSRTPWYPGHYEAASNGYAYVNWTQVSANPNIWDLQLTGNQTLYNGICNDTYGFWYKEGDTFEVLSVNTSGMRNIAFHGNFTHVALYDTTLLDNGALQTMLKDCPLLTSIPRFDTTGHTQISQMLSGCSSLTFVPKLDTSNMEGASYLFYNCTSLTSIPDFNFSSLIVANHMFEGCTSLTEIPQIDGPLQQVLQMCNNCTSLTKVGYMDLSRVDNTTGMFNNCVSLTEIPAFDLSNTSLYAKDMFKNCSSLQYIPDLNLGAYYAQSMFDGCVSVNYGITTAYNQLRQSVSGNLSHYDTFKNCGTNSATGSAELAQIPDDWKGINT
jgi:hypothetical protein